jgi:hypothetical protein
MKIKPICLLSDKCFQVPFSYENIKRYKGISNYKVPDCFYQVLTILGLRHYSVSNQDSRKIHYLEMKDIFCEGVVVTDASKYLSHVFQTNITCSERMIDQNKIDELNKINQTNDTLYENLVKSLDLKNGYATLICGSFVSNKDKNLNGDYVTYGHYFIVHKQNDIIYYYDQSYKIHTKDIHRIERMRNAKMDGFFMYKNEECKNNCILNKDKIRKPIPFS